MPEYFFNIESDGCHFDLKGASFLDQNAAEQFARRLGTFFHPKLWSPTVVLCDHDGEEVFRSSNRWGKNKEAARTERHSLT